jgi:hypothetical protein
LEQKDKTTILSKSGDFQFLRFPQESILKHKTIKSKLA